MTSDVTETEIRAAMRNGIEASVVSDARWPRETYADAYITCVCALASLVVAIVCACDDSVWVALSVTFGAGANTAGASYLAARARRFNAHRERSIAAVREYARGDDP